MTREQRAIALTANALIHQLNVCVPNSTIHWAVEDARKALAHLARMAESVRTTDAPDATHPAIIEHVARQSPVVTV